MGTINNKKRADRFGQSFYVSSNFALQQTFARTAQFLTQSQNQAHARKILGSL
jgi:hypothetical protein